MAHEEPAFDLPSEPIHRVTGPLGRFLHVEAASGVVLLVAALIALGAANSAGSESFLGFWKTKIAIGDFVMSHSLKHWVSDGLMAIFFFVVGLEVKREIVLGELRDMRQAALPLAAALGGMVVPAACYLALVDGPAARGWGIPMATDIAFVVGCMAMLGSRVPSGLRVLLSLAIADDIGAILVIAIGYTTELSLAALAFGFAGLGVVVGMRLLGVRAIPLYVAVGAGVWVAFHESGVHATIAGVILGLLTPTRARVSDPRLTAMMARAGELWRGDESDGPASAPPSRAVRQGIARAAQDRSCGSRTAFTPGLRS